MIMNKCIKTAQFCLEILGKSPSWFSHKAAGRDSKGGFDTAEQLRIAEGLERLANELRIEAQQMRDELRG